jgi:hypothetical protein
MPPVVPPWTAARARARSGRIEREPAGARLGMPSGRITDILNGRGSIIADTALHLSATEDHPSPRGCEPHTA